MSNFSVIESQGGIISELMRSKLRDIRASGHTCPALSQSGEESMARGIHPDLLVVSPKSAKSLHNIPETGCGILLVPDTASDAAKKLTASSVVSYGLGAKNSISLSSIDKGSFVMSIQRDLPTVTGSTIERQEIPIRHPSNVSTEDAMAGAAALLILGAEPGCITWS